MHRAVAQLLACQPCLLVCCVNEQSAERNKTVHPCTRAPYLVPHFPASASCAVLCCGGMDARFPRHGVVAGRKDGAARAWEDALCRRGSTEAARAEAEEFGCERKWEVLRHLNLCCGKGAALPA